MALPQPPKTSQNVPRSSAIARLVRLIISPLARHFRNLRTTIIYNGNWPERQLPKVAESCLAVRLQPRLPGFHGRHRRRLALLERPRVHLAISKRHCDAHNAKPLAQQPLEGVWGLFRLTADN